MVGSTYFITYGWCIFCQPLYTIDIICLFFSLLFLSVIFFQILGKHFRVSLGKTFFCLFLLVFLGKKIVKVCHLTSQKTQVSHQKSFSALSFEVVHVEVLSMCKRRCSKTMSIPTNLLINCNLIILAIL